MQRLDLNGIWDLFWTDLRTGTLAEANAAFSEGKAIGCPVPGGVHMGLVEAGIIQEPLEALHAKECRWMEEKEWWYGRTFAVTEDFLKDRSFLRFEGLDLSADIWLNDHFLGAHENAFIPVEYDVTEHLVEGENRIVVRIDEGMYNVRDRSVELMAKSWNADQPYRAWMRKPQYVYGWDWTVWLPTCGLWRGVVLESGQQARLEDVFIRTDHSLFAEGQSQAGIGQAAELRVSASIDPFAVGSYRLQVEMYGDDRYDARTATVHATAQAEFLPGQTETAFTIPLPDPQLWWPNGSGRPYLYTVVVNLLNGEGAIIDNKAFSYGIKHTEFRELEIGEGNRTFTLYVNGVPIFAKGANWVPADALPGRVTRDKVERLLQSFVDCHMNMIRVWGGGVYESEDFFDCCDRLGIMVWHDFMYACAYYPDFDEGFVANITHESITVIKLLRNRASLIGWAGNNEIHAMHWGISTWHKDVQFHGRKIYDEILPALCAEYDPDRIYRKGSPYGGDFPDSVKEGDQHVWHFTHVHNHPDYLNIWKYPDGRYKFLSEFGIMGPMNRESMAKCISPDQRYPGSDEWKLHHNTAYLQDSMLRNYFGSIEEWSTDTYILKGQAIQAEAMRHLYETLRSRKFECSGVLMWTFSDAFGTHGWAAVDYYLGKKPLYYYLRRALSPLAIAWKGYVPNDLNHMRTYREDYAEGVPPLEAWVMNDSLQDRTAAIRYKVMTLDGRILQEGETSKSIPENSTRTCLEISLTDLVKTTPPEQMVIAAEVFEDGVKVNENRYFPAPFRDLQLAPASLDCAVTVVDVNTVRLTLTSDTYIWMLHLATPDEVVPSDNDADLIAGVSRTLTVRVPDAAEYKPEFASPSQAIHVHLH